MKKYIAIFAFLFLLTLTGCKKTHKVTINFHNGEHSIVKEVKNKELITKPDDPIKENHSFIGWYENDEIFDFNKPITSDTVIDALFKKVKCVVSFETLCDQTVESILVDTGSKCSQGIILSKTGYTFNGWLLNGEEFDFSTPINDDITLVANWIPKVLKVTIKNFDNDIISIQEVNYGDCCIKPTIPIRDGYDFVGWFDLDELYTFEKQVKTNMILYEKWDMKLEKIKQTLDELVPSTTKSSIILPTTLPESSASIVWTSSDEDIISNLGKFSFPTKDMTITLQAKVSTRTHEATYTYNVSVNKLVLKPLIKGQIVSGYLTDFGGTTSLPQKAIEKIDIINYSFASISNGEVYISSSNNLGEILGYRNYGVRVILAIGGWGSGGFSNAMLTSAGRTKLVNSIMNVIKEYQFDGIDLDWEYPTSGVAGIDYNSNDKQNLNAFCAELKQKMTAYREDLLLTMAVTTSDSFYDYRTLDKYVDYFNLMTYDFALGNTANHDSAVYSNSYASSSMDSAVKFLKQRVDASKIIPGSAFYCRRGSFSSKDKTTLGANLGTQMVNGSISYKKLKEMMLKDPNMVTQYDDVAKAAYIINGINFYSFEDELCIKYKCDYVKEYGLGGLMCWDFSQDYVDELGNSVLIDAMFDNLK